MNDLFGNPTGVHFTSMMEICGDILDKRDKDAKFKAEFDKKLNVREEQKPRIENGKLIRAGTT